MNQPQEAITPHVKQLLDDAKAMIEEAEYQVELARLQAFEEAARYVDGQGAEALAEGIRKLGKA